MKFTKIQVHMGLLIGPHHQMGVYNMDVTQLGTVQAGYSQVKSSQVVGLRDRVAIIRTLIFSSPHPHAGSGEVWLR